jgi:ketosteroid isomerase-like protein
MVPDLPNFAEDWIKDWNSHDLERILRHYADDVEITSPMIKFALGIEDGTVSGKAAAREYWAAALAKVPDLRFELFDCTQGVDTIALYYKSVMAKTAIEVMFFDEEGLINMVIVHYD